MQNNFYALLYEIIDASPLHNTKARISTLMIKVDAMLWNNLVWYPLYAVHRFMLIWGLIMFSEIFSITELPKKLEPLSMLYNFYICKWYIIKFRNFLYCLKLVPHVYVRLCRHKFRRPTRESSNKDLYFKDKLLSV